jgi:DNA repair protein RadA/Sms
VVVAEAGLEPPAAIPLGLSEVERVLSGGLEPGSVTLVAGAPGIGKSTLCTQLAVFAAATGHSALVIAAEESLGQVARRTTRLGGGSAQVSVLATADLGEALAALEDSDAGLCVVDSVSTMSDPALRSLSGGVAQVRNAAEQLSAVARRRQIALLLVGHVTKDGDLAGPRALEHLVDTVLTIEGDRHHRRRVVSTVKHRFGPAGEVGILELEAEGLVSVEDPSAMLLAERGQALPGSVATVLAEGLRPLVVEIQALVTPAISSPARVAQGVSATRLRQLAAVLDAHLELGIGRSDLFVACSGAVKATEPAVDVAVVAAIVSAFFGTALDPRVVAIGELGLTGSVRSVLSVGRRLEEAARVGLELAIVPPRSEVPTSMQAIEVATVAELVAAVTRHSTELR